ncbi:MAG: hypothetical protein KAQ97_10305, partial [Candidatus Fermentibacteraceae bacterium]|nr:hypothetical protein [Candidatus Fermentibacteraceae bacterium]
MRNLVVTVVIVFLCTAAVNGYTGATLREVLTDGTIDMEYEGTNPDELNTCTEDMYIPLDSYDSGEIWHYSVASGLTQKIAP